MPDAIEERLEKKFAELKAAEHWITGLRAADLLS
jgi:hypothetical protein